MAGYVAMLLGSIGCYALDRTQVWYYLSYWLMGGALGIVYAPLIAWLTQDPHAEAHVLGRRRVPNVLVIFCISWNVGLAAGQLTGGAIFRTFGPAAPIVPAMVMLVACLVLVVLAARRYRALPAAPRMSPTDSSLATQTRSSQFARLAWLANLGGSFCMSMVIHLFPNLAVALGLPSDSHGLILGASRVVAVAAYITMHLSSFWHYRFSTALVSQAIAIAGMVVLTVAHQPWQLLIGLAALAQLSGYNYFASLYYSTSSTEDQKGAASGMHEATLALGFAAGSFLGGVVGQRMGSRSPYVLGALVIAALALVQIMVRQQQGWRGGGGRSSNTPRESAAR